MERLKNMKETLIGCVQGQLSHLDSVNAEELGEVVDMIKDLEEAIYYGTITKSMKEKEEMPKYYPTEYYRDMDRDMGRRYYSPMHYGEGNEGNRSGSYNYAYEDGSSSNSNSGNSGASRNYTERELPMMRDVREGRSPLSRKMYMEAKEMHKDKAVQMKELDAYMQELSKDITEMIEGASPEEKQLLQQKINGLASKIH